jgi:hypothetical protein
MKVLIGSLAAAALLCLFIVSRSSFGQPNDYFCDGPFNGCGNTNPCFYFGGSCGANNTPYAAYGFLGADAYSCEPSSEEDCHDDIDYAVCQYKYYATYDDGTCLDEIMACRYLEFEDICEQGGD